MVYRVKIEGNVSEVSTVRDMLALVGPHVHVTGPSGLPASTLLAKVPGTVLTFFRTIDNKRVRSAIRTGKVRGQVAAVVEVRD